MENKNLHAAREADMQKRENELVLKMARRMSQLEEQVKEVQVRLSDAVKTIAEKDEQIENLKAKVLKEGADELEEGHYQPKSCRLVSERKECVEKVYSKQDLKNGLKNGKKLTEVVEERINKSQCPMEGPRNITQKENNNLRISNPGTQTNDNIGCETQSSDNESLSDKTSQEMDEEFSRLTNQVLEMEKFLADYGLIWVGDANIRDGDNYRTVQASIGFSPNFEKIIMVISELNDIVSSESHVEVSKKGGKFKKAEVLKLALFADGIQLEDNPFREYSSQSVQEFFRDLEDGYYPTELKDIYPDGVIFRIIDNRSTTFEEAQNGRVKAFSGTGQKLGYSNENTVEPKRNLPPYPGPSGKENEKPTQFETSIKKDSKIKSRERPVDFNRRHDHLEEKPKAIISEEKLNGMTKGIISEEKSKGMTKGISEEKPKEVPKPRTAQQEDEKSNTDSNESNLVKQNEIQGLDSKTKYNEAENPSIASAMNVNEKSGQKLETFIGEESKNNIKIIDGEKITGARDMKKSRTQLFRDKIEITNITYNEAPITITQPLQQQGAIAHHTDCLQDSKCNCPIPVKSHPTVLVDNAVRPGQELNKHYEKGKAYDISELSDGDGEYIYSKEIMHSSDESSPSSVQILPKIGITEYRQQYDDNVKNIIEAINKRGAPIKAPQIDINEEFEHFTFLGKPKTDQLNTEKSKLNNTSTGNAAKTETNATLQQTKHPENETDSKPEKKSMESFTEDEESEETTGIVTFPND